MPGRPKIALLIATLWAPTILLAQQEGSYPQVIEELLYKNESWVIPEELYSMHEEAEDILIHLNNASQEQLEASSLFSPYQIHQLLSYRQRFGTIYSIYELTALPGFDVSMLTELESCIALTPGAEVPQKRRRGKHMVMIDVGKSHPESVAYKGHPDNQGEKVYAGSPMHTTFRIRSQSKNHLSLGLTYEKDAGEELLYKGKPQYLSGYLQYQGNRILKQLLIGTFQLNHGLGLVNGTGFFHHPASISINQQTLARLRPYASKTEQRYERGLASKMEWLNFQMLIWASYTHQDLSPGSLRDGSEAIRWWEHQRASGLHRSNDELEGHNLATRHRTGVQLLYRNREFALGIMAGSEKMGLSKKGRSILDKNEEPFTHHVASVHGTWLRGRWQLFGEVAAEGTPALALQMGCMVHFSDFVRGTMLAYQYGNGYKGMLPSSYSRSSQVGNEQGVAFHLHMEPGSLLVADFTAELCKYPAPRYQCLVPSSAFRINFSLQNPSINPLQWKLRLVSKTWQSTPTQESTGVNSLKNSRVTRFDGRFVFQNGSSLRWQSRLVISLLSSTPLPVPAYASLQELRFQATPKLHSTIQFVVFRIKDWENRIYLHEPSFYYSFRFPSYYGSGQKTTLLLTLKAHKGIILSVKISGTRYYDREESGSGKDLVPGNKRWETGVQLRLKF